MKHKVNEKFFETIDSEEKAYFLGLLAADGYNSEKMNRIFLGLQIQDGYIVKKLSKFLINKCRVRYDKPSNNFFKKEKRIIKGNGRVVFQLQNEKISSDLSKLGIVSRKSLILKFPDEDDIPNNLLCHYIRGYIDGDGCISRRFNHSAARWTISILSSENFCIEFCKRIKLILNIDNLKTKKDKNSKIYKIEFGGNRKVKIFLDWLYKDAKYFLKRKYKKYKELNNDLERIDKRLDNTYSKFNNISYDKTRKKWTAIYRIKNKSIYLGRFDTEESAYKAQQQFIAKQTISNRGELLF